MKFSLILATVNRIKEVELFLESLQAQEYRNFELIVVDQNKDDAILSILAPFRGLFTIHYLKCTPGASKARNLGITISTGDIIGFPDDDCLYTKNLLQEVADFFRKENYEGLTIRMENSLDNGISFSNLGDSRKLNLKDAFSFGTPATFVLKKVTDSIGLFDENLGPGTTSNVVGGKRYKIMGGEDIEFIIRAMKKNFSFYYDKTIIFKHPALDPFIDKKNKKLFQSYKKRTESAGASDYYVFKKHFSLLERMSILLNNASGIFYYMILKGDIKTAMRHYYRCKGMAYAIIHLK